ncbi:PH domain-containing protein [Flavobacterium sp.]|uniref:PH domain-containing protein n=1 Tax=Flavobacterium sp. TaxID=239 RepID=UPI0039E6E32B
MENFTNETIDTAQLPRFEEVAMTALHRDYWKVVLLTWLIIFGVIAIGLVAAVAFIEEFQTIGATLLVPLLALIGLCLFFARISFRKKAFAFRNHDVLFRHGIIATTTIVIPYNRVQHVALHEGFISRFFGLATIEIFTAGGSSSDIEIPGIEKEQAENIKQLLMGKIQKEL